MADSLPLAVESLDLGEPSTDNTETTNQKPDSPSPFPLASPSSTDDLKDIDQAPGRDSPHPNFTNEGEGTPLSRDEEEDEEITEEMEQQVRDRAESVCFLPVQSEDPFDNPVDPGFADPDPPLCNGVPQFIDQEPSDPKFAMHNKHIFIMSSAGKPIYTRYGDEASLGSLMGVFYAMISFVQDEDADDEIQTITAGNVTISFLVRGSIYLVEVSKSGENAMYLHRTLSTLHSQIISILTSHIEAIFRNKARYDLRKLLSGTDRFLHQIVPIMDYELSYMANAVQCVPLDPAVRKKIYSIMASVHVPNLVYGLIISRHRLVALARVKKHLLHPSDLHLLYNFVSGNSHTLNGGDAWTPICLPAFNPASYLYAYISALAPQVNLVLLSTSAGDFGNLADIRQTIHNVLLTFQSLVGCGALTTIEAAVKEWNYVIPPSTIPYLRHFFYKWNSNVQITAPCFTAPYDTPEERQRLFRLYQELQLKLEDNNLKVLYTVTKHESILCWTTPSFELMAVFPPELRKPATITLCNKLLRWIKEREKSLFVLNSTVW